MGIHLQDYANHNIIFGNTVSENTGDGIRIHLDYCDNNSVVANVSHGNADNQISIENTTEYIKADNKV